METQEERKARFEKAARIFADRMKAHPEVIGVISSGTFMHDQVDPHSDIDVHVILEESVNQRERGNTWVEDVEIEYFMNPPQQVRAYFIKEVKSPHTAHMLIHGRVEWKADPILDTLIAEAHEIMKNPPAFPNALSLKMMRYQLDDLWKDWLDCIYREDAFAGGWVKNHYLDFAINSFCQVHRVWRTKDKRLEEQLASISPAFTLLLKKCFFATWNEMQVMKDLHEMMAGYAGGKRSREWILRGGLDL
ncbi:MAG: hypothetical protein AAFW00_21930 [Bacteroidota bacterium]